MSAGGTAAAGWVRVCSLSDLVPDRGAAAMVGRSQVALFRLADDSLYAVGHHDPFSGANVMARGMVGSRGGVDTVASPMHKQTFDLRTGLCLDDQQTRLPVWQVRLVDGSVQVSAEPAAANDETLSP